MLELALLFIGVGALLGWLLASCWQPLLARLDRLLPPRHLRRTGVRYRSDRTREERS
nr:cellulose biosynthesis protein BcsF [Stutzerimonas stutzeri]